LKLRLPIQAAKGYSVTVKAPQAAPQRPLLLSEARIAVTPLGELLRFAGTLEIAGLDFSINQRRVNAIRRGAPRYLTGMDDLELVEIWRGLRPVTPDGLPIIGRAPGYDNLILAAGHAMIGQSLGPITGKLVAQVAWGEPPAMDLAPLRAERFN
jgi:D-amino-acid dehydrogenase